MWDEEVKVEVEVEGMQDCDLVEHWLLLKHRTAILLDWQFLRIELRIWIEAKDILNLETEQFCWKFWGCWFVGLVRSKDRLEIAFLFSRVAFSWQSFLSITKFCNPMISSHMTKWNIQSLKSSSSSLFQEEAFLASPFHFSNQRTTLFNNFSYRDFFCYFVCVVDVMVYKLSKVGRIGREDSDRMHRNQQREDFPFPFLLQ